MTRSLTVALFLVLLVGVGCKRTITVTLDGTGEVMSEDGTLDCNAGCSLELDKGVVLELSAAAPPGSRFEGWGGACTGTAGCSVTLEDNVVVSARFVRTASLQVDIDGDGEGAIVSKQPCAKGCELHLNEGANVVLEPKPAEGMEFEGWRGACTGNGKCELSLTGEQRVTATFVIPLGTALGNGKLEVFPGRRVAGVLNVHTNDGVLLGTSGGPNKEPVEFIRMDMTGARLWTMLPKPEEMSELHDLAAMSDYGFVAVGRAGRSDCAILRYRDEGKLGWKVVLPDCGVVRDVEITGTAGSEVIVVLGDVGAYGSGFNFLGTPLTMKGNTDAFVARLDDDGGLISVVSFGTRTPDEPRALALSPDGAVSYVDVCAKKACRVLALGADGSEMWSQPYAKDALTVRAMAATESSVYVVGRLDGTAAKIGTGLLKGLAIGDATPGCSGGFGVLTRLARSGGQSTATTLLGADLTGVLTRPRDVVVLGTYGPGMKLAGRELGDGECTSTEDVEAFVGGVSETGEGMWLQTFGEKTPPFAEALSLDREGRAIALARAIGEPGAVDEAPPGIGFWLRLK